MDTHKNAPLTAKGREAMVRAVVEGGLSQAAAARQFNVTPKTVAKWVLRFRAEGVAGLQDRSSRPRSSPSQTAPATCARVEASATLYRQANRRRSRRFGRHRQPHPETVGPQPPGRARAGRAGPPL
jgi:transposase